MNKQEFIIALGAGLSGLPRKDIEERLVFYSEMIDDRVEDGLTEEEAVCDIGSVEEVVAQIVAEIPLLRVVGDKIRPKRRLRGWEVLLLVLGSPVWASLLVAAASVIFSLYLSVWAVIVSLWATAVSLLACSLGGIAFGVGLAVSGSTLTGIWTIGAGLVLAGLSILAFYGCRAATRGLLLLTKTAAIGLKRRIAKKEEM